VESFKAVMELRDYILTAGREFDYDQVKEALDERNLLDQKTIEFLANKSISDYEKWCVIQEKLGDEYKIATKLDQGHVYAPCPHDQGCPKMSGGRIHPCKFEVRWAEARSDGKTNSINRDGTETGNFCYFIMEKGERPEGIHRARILSNVHNHRFNNFTVCTQFDGLQNINISSRSKEIFKRMKNLREGQLARVDVEIVKSDPDSEMKFVREMIQTEDSKHLGETDEDHQEALEEICSVDHLHTGIEKSGESVGKVEIQDK